jgi:hypothetical protein
MHIIVNANPTLNLVLYPLINVCVCILLYYTDNGVV